MMERKVFFFAKKKYLYLYNNGRYNDQEEYT